MEGRGVTNYSSDKPSHQITTKTTEFDDALLKRGIVSLEQVYLAKGASPDEAQKLIVQQQQKQKQQNNESNNGYKIHDDDDDDDDDDSFQDDIDDIDDDDEFFERYRQERLAQLTTTQQTKASSSSSNSNMIEHISRNDWSIKVNDASKNNNQWVLITLVDDNDCRNKQEIQQELYNLSRIICNNTNTNNFEQEQEQKQQISILTINSTDAIPNWPKQNIPTIFAYKDGIKQKEWITTKYGQFPTQQQLQRLLQIWGVIV